MRRSGIAGALLSAAALLAWPARGFDIVGPNKCMGCHDHEPQKLWAEKKEGPKGHLNALAQLEDKRSAGWGKAIGLADVYDLKGSCVSCHATVFKGDANAGVSCETCHGPGSGYLEPHQRKGAYAEAVKLGMYDTRNNLAAWAKMCLDCHVMTDRKLIAAGHPSGHGFDLSVKSFGQVVHWNDTFDKVALGAAGRVYEARLLGGAPPKEALAALKSAPSEAPKSAPTAAPGPTKPVAVAATSVVTGPGAIPKEAPKVATQELPKTAPQAGLPAPLPRPLPRLTEMAASGVVAEAAAARGRVLMALSRALRDGSAGSNGATPSGFAAAAEYTGPEAELLRLQDDVLALQLVALAGPARSGATP